MFNLVLKCCCNPQSSTVLVVMLLMGLKRCIRYELAAVPAIQPSMMLTNSLLKHCCTPVLSAINGIHVSLTSSICLVERALIQGSNPGQAVAISAQSQPMIQFIDNLMCHWLPLCCYHSRQIMYGASGNELYLHIVFTSMAVPTLLLGPLCLHLTVVTK